MKEMDKIDSILIKNIKEYPFSKKPYLISTRLRNYDIKKKWLSVKEFIKNGRGKRARRI